MSSGFSRDRAVQQARFEPYEMLEAFDLLFFGGGQYETLGSLAAQLVRNEVGDASALKATILSGLQVIPQSGLSIQLRSGLAVSFDGYYTVNESSEVMSYSAAAGDAFLCMLADIENLTIQTAHATNDRRDLIEIRPLLDPYDSQTRSFKDPVLGTVSTQLADIKREVTCEAHVVKGVEDGSDVAPTTTVGWIKVAEVEVPALTATITSGLIHNVDAVFDSDNNTDWTVELDNTRLWVLNKARAVYLLDSAGRFAATQVEGALAELAGASRTTENVYANAAAIIPLIPMKPGHIQLSLTNYDAATVPQVAANSYADVNGIMVSWTSNTTITGTPTTDSINYVYSTSGGAVSWSTTAPTWSNLLQGWYDGTSRAIAACWYDGTNYRAKVVLLSQHCKIDQVWLNVPLVGFSKNLSTVWLEGDRILAIAAGTSDQVYIQVNDLDTNDVVTEFRGNMGVLTSGSASVFLSRVPYDSATSVALGGFVMSGTGDAVDTSIINPVIDLDGYAYFIRVEPATTSSWQLYGLKIERVRAYRN